ncbi:MAG: protein of unknown function (DUF4335) [Candidatus Atelocyanobacterium thalassa isolate SIO64986]|uniref:Uncharacterized protein n=1 Tax=Candidatus Atelocyanobacterium thalassa isolate SIO64986 TaxID=1527444 RepID=A0A086CFY7_9CHRO|nr:MAG: protein of unknown function (DUF4335) [Candidatus Atelocyanobacterium thalassa isolate SIO64986]
MNIRRCYSLPNCTLVLEGLDNKISSHETHQILSTLVNAECKFLGIPQKLEGGHIFFENLVKVTSEYVQAYLSGIPHPLPSLTEKNMVNIEKLSEGDLHSLTWSPSVENKDVVMIVLTTVQLFDLVEAIDQFFADNHTLPNFNLELKPISNRYHHSDESFTELAIPIIIAVTSLSFISLLLSFIPVPEIVEPKPNLSPVSVETSFYSTHKQK